METVVSCVKLKEVNGKSVYAIGLSDGQGGESFATEIPIGTPVSELMIEESQWGKKFKLKRAFSGGGWGGGGAKPRSGNESFALSYAKDLVVGGKVELKHILSTADKFYGWLESKKSASAPTVTIAPAPASQRTNGNGMAPSTQQPPAVVPTVGYKGPQGPQEQATDDLPF